MTTQCFDIPGQPKSETFRSFSVAAASTETASQSKAPITREVIPGMGCPARTTQTPAYPV